MDCGVCLFCCQMLLRGNGPSRPMDKYMPLENEIERSNQQFLDDTHSQQQVHTHARTHAHTHAQYQVSRTAQSALHFTSWTGLFKQTPSQILWEAFSHAAINV